MVSAGGFELPECHDFQCLGMMKARLLSAAAGGRAQCHSSRVPRQGVLPPELVAPGRDNAEILGNLPTKLPWKGAFKGYYIGLTDLMLILMEKQVPSV